MLTSKSIYELLLKHLEVPNFALKHKNILWTDVLHAVIINSLSSTDPVTFYEDIIIDDSSQR